MEGLKRLCDVTGLLVGKSGYKVKDGLKGGKN